jgi:hypothetical protein
MGFSYDHDVERAGLYLLGLLKSEGRVRYSRFYDGTDETYEAIIRAMGYPEEGDSYLPECPEHLIDLAAWQLETGGIVKITPLAEKLADGEQDYTIELTEEGRQFLERGDRFRFWTAA